MFVLTADLDIFFYCWTQIIWKFSIECNNLNHGLRRHFEIGGPDFFFGVQVFFYNFFTIFWELMFCNSLELTSEYSMKEYRWIKCVSGVWNFSISPKILFSIYISLCQHYFLLVFSRFECQENIKDVVSPLLICK